MILKSFPVGRGKKAHNRYVILEENTWLAYFDDIATASLVMRFIKGAHLEKQDYARAINALSAWDEAHSGKVEGISLRHSPVGDADADLEEETDSSDSI